MLNKDINQLIGNKISEFRDRKGLTQLEISEKLAMSRSAYNQLEIGKTKITVERLYEISEILEVPMQYFLPGQSKDIDQTSIIEFSDKVLGDVLSVLDSFKGKIAK
ncbi:MAG: helix-turn-helix domain-containing protein [Leptospiraceae bacterium]|nr:helix-turn-helix domain-containing protein [Leptospiraceae bacterium]